MRPLPSPPGAEEYLALEKPPGRGVHGKDGVLEEARAELGAELHLVHRLDRDTSGVLLLARSRAALVAAHAAWPKHVTKTYLARTRGVPSPREGAIELPLLESRTGKPELLRRALRAAYGPARAGHLLSGRRVRAIPPPPAPGTTAVHPAGRPARTEYRVVENDGITALVEVSPREGRMHQIRVHLAALGTPVLGDRLYDAAAREDDAPPLLHLARLLWRDPPGAAPGTVWTWESPVPPRSDHLRA
ncbi:MAG TPA: RNA pseudouridine synthase [Thermoanaerobaculia bacterium]|nr:RNA pseudouridine synthase [Thermoanaerobaculia bacterium]